jgi:hypothetical protein
VARLEGRSRFIFSGMDILSRVSDVNRGTMLEELRINRRCGFTLYGNEGVNDFVVSRSVGRQPYNSGSEPNFGDRVELTAMTEQTMRRPAASTE